MNIEKYRKETPGTNNVIHFNNAGSSLMPKPVFNTITEYLEEELNLGGYEMADKYRKVLDNFYPQIASLIHAHPEEIAFMESATNAWDMAFFSIPFRKGDIILTSRIEYASNYIAYLQIEQRTKVRVQPVESNEYGEVDIEALEKRVKEGGVRLISMTHMPTNGGIVNPAEEVGKIAKKYGVLYLLDACQSAGQYPLDVEKLQCDFLSATGRKYMRGPRGTGFLYARKDSTMDIEPLSLDLHSAEWTGPKEFKMREDARRFEKWECNPANKLGLAKAAEYCKEADIEKIWDRVQILSNKLRNKLRELPGIEVLDLGRIQSGIVTFRSDRIKASKIKYLLAGEKINTSMAIASGTLLDMNDRNIETAVRASVHYYNSEEEIDRFIQVLSKLVRS